MTPFSRRFQVVLDVASCYLNLHVSNISTTAGTSLKITMFTTIVFISRTNVASVGSGFKTTSHYQLPDKGTTLETSIFPLSFQVVREPIPLLCLSYDGVVCRSVTIAYHYLYHFKYKIIRYGKLAVALWYKHITI